MYSPTTRILGLAAGVSLALMPSLTAMGAESAGWGKCPAKIRDLVDQADRITRGESSIGDVSMKVYKRGTASMRMKMWSRGRDKFLARIAKPSRLRGMATLKSGENLWNYLPRMDRVVKLGSSMMGGSWMGSHFTNDDLVKETDIRTHYTCEAFKEDEKTYEVTLRPRANAPVVWGKVVMSVRKKGPMPLWTRYYDERDKLKRTMTFENSKKMGGREVPTRLVLQPADAPSERTELVYHSITFDVPIRSGTFTLRGLKR